MNNKQNEQTEDHFFWWIIGIFLLTGALLLSAGMGIFQEQLYKNHGKHPEEALYYTVSIINILISIKQDYNHQLNATEIMLSTL